MSVLYMSETPNQQSALVLVDDAIKERRARYLADTGRLVRVHQGVYVAADADPARVCRRFALRIASYLYPSAHLAGWSGIVRGIAPDGILHLNSGRRQSTSLPGLEIEIAPGPRFPALVRTVLKDEIGSFILSLPEPVQSAVEIGRIGRAFDQVARDLLADLDRKLLAAYGDRAGIDAALDAFAARNGWSNAPERYRELVERSTRETAMTKDPDPLVASGGAARVAFLVAWHRRPIGRLAHDGASWTWTHDEGFLLPRIPQETAGALPAFIQNLLPEGWLDEVLKERSDLDRLLHGRRYLSNISIVRDPRDLAVIPIDRLSRRLADVSTPYVPTYFDGDGRVHPIPPAAPGYIHPGGWNGEWISKDLEAFEQSLADLWKDRMMPRLSGVQMKVPVSLRDDGTVGPAGDGLEWTHILKLPGTSQNSYQALGSVEWLGMLMAKSCGLETAETALFPMPDRPHPALLVERFDIPRNPDDQVMRMTVDLCTLFGLGSHPSEQKYGHSMEKVAKLVAGEASDSTATLRRLYQRTVFAWVIGDGDMHLKNIALLREALPNETKYRSIGMSPVYDALTTTVFPGLENDQMALTIAGKRDNLKMRTWEDFGSRCGLEKSKAATMLMSMASQCAQVAASVAKNPPALVRDDPLSEMALRKVASFIAGRARVIGVTAPAWTEEDEALLRKPAASPKGPGF